ncbi:hypothetical protein Leryth_001478 [Lithospermum erythrorhizon]|nr:hypothetical protein Leryth_001478 [Lithospermum erythrorhizon]
MATTKLPQNEDSSSEDDQNWDDWDLQNDAISDDDNAFDTKMVCLFCDELFDSSDALFEHCSLVHNFDFYGIKKELDLNFYGCFKLINYVRSKVAEHNGWSWGLCKDSYDGINYPWNDDIYLKPYMEEDAVLYSFAEADEAEEDDTLTYDKKELEQELSTFNPLIISDDEDMGNELSKNQRVSGIRAEEVDVGKSNGFHKLDSVGSSQENGTANVGGSCSLYVKHKDEQLTFNSSRSSADAVKKINKNYFDSYSSFSIHREMISDKARTDAYRQAIMGNPSLLKDSVVMDVGCGTGILSLFAAQSGASRVLAVEASERMAGFAKQIAKDNDLLKIENPDQSTNHHTGTMEVVQGMIEELGDSYDIPHHSVDVLISEWMGYCLLYESMLSSVLFARDRWLKPGGAILPDVATMFVAGFGKGGTSIPFWENVYGLNMSCIAKEVVEDAAHFPIVDVLDSREVVTETEVLQSFDLPTMKLEDMDFTAEVELKPILNYSNCISSEPKTTWCYGIVLWFETGFTDRFCKEHPTLLSTSPYAPTTHWCQTILTFKEPIAISSEKPTGDVSGAIGSDAFPAVTIHSRISIVRAIKHRSIDISMELTGISSDGQKRNWPAQLFNLL